MDINNLLRADYLDIIFEGRNKMYGGYELRRKYARRSRRAGMIVIASAVLLSAVPTLASMFGKKAAPPLLHTSELIIQPPPVLPDKEVAPPPPPPPPTSDYAPPPTIAAPELVVAPDDVVEHPPVTVEEMRDKVVAMTTSDGPGDPSLIPGPAESGSGPGGPGVDLVAAKRPDAIRVVEQMPQFPGDINAWLAAKLRYPPEAQQRDQEGRSVIEFIVNEDGSIEAARVARGSFPLLDAEALRVVNAMPKWKPGKQNGKTVRVIFTLPVEFRIG